MEFQIKKWKINLPVNIGKCKLCRRKYNESRILLSDGKEQSNYWKVISKSNYQSIQKKNREMLGDDLNLKNTDKKTIKFMNEFTEGIPDYILKKKALFSSVIPYPFNKKILNDSKYPGTELIKDKELVDLMEKYPKNTFFSFNDLWKNNLNYKKNLLKWKFHLLKRGRIDNTKYSSAPHEGMFPFIPFPSWFIADSQSFPISEEKLEAVFLGSIYSLSQWIERKQSLGWDISNWEKKVLTIKKKNKKLKNNYSTLSIKEQNAFLNKISEDAKTRSRNGKDININANGNAYNITTDDSLSVYEDYLIQGRMLRRKFQNIRQNSNDIYIKSL